MFKIGDEVIFNGDDYYDEYGLSDGCKYNILDIDRYDDTILVYSESEDEDVWVNIWRFSEIQRVDKKKQFINNLCSK